MNGGLWTGNGVTFYFADTSKIQFNSGMEQRLKAPSSDRGRISCLLKRPGFRSRISCSTTATGRNSRPRLSAEPECHVQLNHADRIRTARHGDEFVIFDDTDMRIGPLNGSGPSTPQGPILIR